MMSSMIFLVGGFIMNWLTSTIRRANMQKPRARRRKAFDAPCWIGEGLGRRGDSSVLSI